MENDILLTLLYINNEKGLKESNTSENQSQPLSPPLMQAAVAAAVAVAANAGHQYPIRPMNVSSSKLSSANCNRLMGATSLCSNPVPRTASSMPTDIAPSILSRNFVMDYMWQQQQHHSGIKNPNLHIAKVFELYSVNLLNLSH